MNLFFVGEGRGGVRGRRGGGRGGDLTVHTHRNNRCPYH